jgi:hypothetical protein
MAGDTDSTFTRSAEPSVSEKGLPMETAVSTSKPASLGEKSKEPVQEETAHEDLHRIDTAAQEEADHVYPKAFKLAMITIALCLSVFCMALVCNP